MDDTRTKAEGGDPEAMLCMADSFFTGTTGFIRDEVKAYEWIAKAAALDFPPAIGRKGYCLLRGSGTVQNSLEGGTLLGVAAGRGDGDSQYYLGLSLQKGENGYTKDLAMAKYWLQKAIVEDREWPVSSKAVSALAKKALESIEIEERGRN